MEATAIINKIYEAKRKNIRVYPQHVVRASEVGHPCERYLVLSITKWDERQPHNPGLEFVFEGGRMIEDLAVKDLEEAGFRVYRPEPDRAIAESRPRITGHIDVRVDFGDGKIYTGEIKGLNIIDWERLNTIEDFFKSRKPWIQKYPAQLMTYLYIKGEERGFFYLKSIPRFQPKLIWVDLDLGYMEKILQKTERVERHVAAGTLPDHIDDPSVCENCPFEHVCLPPINRDDLKFLEGDEITELLERREALKEAANEYNQVDRLIKDKLKPFGVVKAVSGGFLIEGKEVFRKGYTVPDSSYIQYRIRKIAE